MYKSDIIDQKDAYELFIDGLEAKILTLKAEKVKLATLTTL